MVRYLEPISILGIMSGTSLDGLDLALCTISLTGSEWSYSIRKAATLPYPSDIHSLLENSIHLPSNELIGFDHQYGKWIGHAAKEFLNDGKLKAEWISSHGHTVFHQPSKGFTLQIGNGNDIAAVTGLPVIYDFRSMDIALGGQGAPLVPVGDEFLFRKYDYCLNLGGFSNISFKKDGRRIAFDICPVNMALNYLSGKMGSGFDRDGEAGRRGKIIPELLNQLNSLKYYAQYPPKSLGREWFIKHVEPLISLDNDPGDLLRSFYDHVAFQVSRVLNHYGGQSVLITGGGAKNTFLLELISQKTGCKLVIPPEELVDFKEALIFAFLGYLRIHGIPNVLSSVTGCCADHCGGVATANLKIR